MNGAQSRLHIAGATYSDSGNYTCMMGRTARAVIELQIIPGRGGEAGSHLISQFSIPRRDGRAGEGRQRGEGEAGRDACDGGGGAQSPPAGLLEDGGQPTPALCQSAKCRFEIIFHFVIINFSQ